MARCNSSLSSFSFSVVVLVLLRVVASGRYRVVSGSSRTTRTTDSQDSNNRSRRVPTHSVASWVPHADVETDVEEGGSSAFVVVVGCTTLQ